MQDRASSDDKISFAFDSEVAELHEGDGMWSGLTLRDTLTGRTRKLAATSLFIAIGHDPRTGLSKGQPELDSEGCLKARSPSTLTNAPGVFGGGDVVDHTHQQAIIAAGPGCAAALDAERYLAALGEARAASVTTVTV